MYYKKTFQTLLPSNFQIEPERQKKLKWKLRSLYPYRWILIVLKVLCSLLKKKSSYQSYPISLSNCINPKAYNNIQPSKTLVRDWHSVVEVMYHFLGRLKMEVIPGHCYWGQEFVVRQDVSTREKPTSILLTGHRTKTIPKELHHTHRLVHLSKPHLRSSFSNRWWLHRDSTLLPCRN